MRQIQKIQAIVTENEYLKSFGFLLICTFIAYKINRYGPWGTLLNIVIPITLLIILIKPVYGLSLAVVLDLWFSYVDLYKYPPRNYLIAYLCCIAILIYCYRGYVVMSKESRKILLVGLLMIFWTMTICYFQDITGPFMQTFKRLVVPLMMGFSTAYFIRNKGQLKLFLWFMFSAMAISAFIGIMQFLDVDFFWNLRGLRGTSDDFVIMRQLINRSRIPGLAYYSIPFGYHLASVTPLVFGILISKSLPIPQRNILLIFFTVVALALTFSLSRGATIGTLLGVLVILHLYRFPIAKVLSVILIFAGLIFSIGFLKERFVTITDVSTLAKLPLFLVSLMIFIDNPLGIGLVDVREYAVAYLPQIIDFAQAGIVFETSSHNQFMNTAVYFGIPGIILLIILYYLIFKTLNTVRINSNDPFIRGVSIGLTGTFISYIFNSSFHNAGPFIGDPFNWYFIGLVMVISQPYFHQKKISN